MVDLDDDKSNLQTNQSVGKSQNLLDKNEQIYSNVFVGKTWSEDPKSDIEILRSPELCKVFNKVAGGKLLLSTPMKPCKKQLT